MLVQVAGACKGKFTLRALFTHRIVHLALVLTQPLSIKKNGCENDRGKIYHFRLVSAYVNCNPFIFIVTKVIILCFQVYNILRNITNILHPTFKCDSLVLSLKVPVEH